MEINRKCTYELEIDKLNAQIASLKKEIIPKRIFPNVKFQENTPENQLTNLRDRLVELTYKYQQKRKWNEDLLQNIGTVSSKLFIDALKPDEIEHLNGNLTLEYDDGRVLEGEFKEGKVLHGTLTLPHGETITYKSSTGFEPIR